MRMTMPVAVLLLAGCGLPSASDFTEAAEQAAIDRAWEQVRVIDKASESWYRKKEEYSPNLAALVPEFLKAEDLKDPWGKPVVYDPQGWIGNNAQKADVFTTSPSGVVVGNWMSKPPSLDAHLVAMGKKKAKQQP